jgi:hypothetical protein
MNGQHVEERLKHVRVIRTSIFASLISKECTLSSSSSMSSATEFSGHACLWAPDQHAPLSTPTTEVKRSDSFCFEALPFAASSFFFCASAVPGIVRFPFVGALAVVNVFALMLLSVCCETTRASRIVRSFRRNCSVSGCVDSMKYLLCFRTSLTLPYESVRSRMKSVMLCGIGTFDSRFSTFGQAGQCPCCDAKD